MNNDITKGLELAIGVDVSDKYSQICVIDREGEVLEESRILTKTSAFRNRFSTCGSALIAIEAGTHSRWIDQLLRELGHEVIVANPRKLRVIYENDSKDDKIDAHMLARVARFDPALLSPIEHRKEEEQEHLELIKARDILVRTRTDLVNHVRGVVKTMGCKLPKCSTESFPQKTAPHIPESLWVSLSPLLDMIDKMTTKIRLYDKKIEELCDTTYQPTTRVLRQVKGVGSLTALAFVLSIGDPYRFKKSRAVGAYLGLRPRKDNSGENKPQLSITKAGNGFLRRLLVGSAHYILGPFGQDCDLRRWGLGKVKSGGKAAKKRAVVGVARKLAVLLHRLLITGEVYEPLRNATK
jgi:transposase